MRREADLARRAPGFSWDALVAGVVGSFVLMLILSGLLALATYTTGLGEGVAQGLVYYLGLLCLALGAAYGSRRAQGRGLVHGAAIGVVYVVLAAAVGLLAFQGNVTLASFGGRLLVGLVVGIGGGVVGVNL